MIVIDSSALVAILEDEQEHLKFVEAISRSDRRLVSAVGYQASGQVAFARRGSDGVRELDRLPTSIEAEIVAHDEDLSRLALDAFQRYGKGVHSKAGLNLGDCAAYALSKKTGAPLLFNGNDFAATDIVACVSPTP